MCWGYNIINSARPTGVDRCGRLPVCVEVVQYHVVQPAELLLALGVGRRAIAWLPHNSNGIKHASQLICVQSEWIL